MRLTALFAAAVAVTVAMPNAAEARVRAGGLACDLAPTIGWIIGSRQQVSCRFTPGSGGPVQVYTGAINRIGLDLGFTAGGKMIWTVFAATNKLGPRALAGTYVGASGDASLGLGGGANILVGGSNRTISLQPLSLQGQAGINLALGVAGMTLR